MSIKRDSSTDSQTDNWISLVVVILIAIGLFTGHVHIDLHACHLPIDLVLLGRECIFSSIAANLGIYLAMVIALVVLILLVSLIIKAISILLK